MDRAMSKPAPTKVPQSAAAPSPFTPIADYAFLSNCHTGALVAPDGEQMHVFSLGGLSWSFDRQIENSDQFQQRALGPWQRVSSSPRGDAAGWVVVRALDAGATDHGHDHLTRSRRRTMT
jgi:hypothetical protein